MCRRIIKKFFPSLFPYTMKKEQDILMRNIALRIKELRRERNLSQTVVTFDTNLNIGRIEACMSGITIQSIAKLCKYFKITIEDFFHGVDMV